MCLGLPGTENIDLEETLGSLLKCTIYIQPGIHIIIKIMNILGLVGRLIINPSFLEN